MILGFLFPKVAKFCQILTKKGIFYQKWPFFGKKSKIKNLPPTFCRAYGKEIFLPKMTVFWKKAKNRKSAPNIL